MEKHNLINSIIMKALFSSLLHYEASGGTLLQPRVFVLLHSEDLESRPEDKCITIE